MAIIHRLSAGKFIRSYFYEIALILVLAVFFAVQLPYTSTEALGSDEALYAWCAKRLAAHPMLIFSGEILEYHPPLFPILLSLGNKLLNLHENYRLMVLLMSLGGIILTYLLGTRIGGKFVGFLSALNLSLNYTYRLNSLLILIDITQMIFCLILLLALCDTDASKPSQRPLLAVTIAAIFLLKWSGIFIVAFIVFYLWGADKSLPRRDKIKTLLAVLGPALFFFFAYYANKFMALGYILPDIHEMVTGGVTPQPAGYYLASLHNILNLPALVLLLGYGVFAMIKTRHPLRRLLFIYLLVSLLSLSLPAVKVIRYSLIILPVLIIIACTGLEDLLKRIFRSAQGMRIARILTLFLCLFFYLSLYPRTAATLAKSLLTSTGLKEAGEWIKSHDDNRGLIICQNLRPMRYFTGINETRFGGRLIYLPGKKKELEELLIKSSGRILVVVDLWSESNPSDFSPFWREAEDTAYFEGLGFRLVKEVKRFVYATRSAQKTFLPVVKIFER